MQAGMDTNEWTAFSGINARRRAIRDFDGRALDKAVLEDILSAALLAPSSGNLQPYQFHLVQSWTLKAKVAEACNRQRAAESASALVVVVSSLKIARTSLDWQIATIGKSDLGQKSKTYYQGVQKTLRTFLRIAPFSIFDALRAMFALVNPVLSLLPFGRSGVAQWAARNTMPAAQTLMLAASARGLDSCPMEGFSASKVAKLLALPRGSVIPVIIALGYRCEPASVEPQTRRHLSDVVVEH